MKMKMAEDLKETFVDVFNWIQKQDEIPDGQGDCQVYPITNWQNELKGAVIGKLSAGKDEVEGICLTFDKNDINVINGKFTLKFDETTTYSGMTTTTASNSDGEISGALEYNETTGDFDMFDADVFITVSREEFELH